MRRLSAALAGGLLALAALTVGAGTAAATENAPVSVQVSRTSVDAGPGEEVRFTSAVTNNGDRDLTGLVAHLSILTSDPGVYVDPEDWSPDRTQYVDRLAPGETTALTWSVQAVTSGPLILYVTVTDDRLDAVGSSGPIDMAVGGQRVVDATAVLPIVLWPPAIVLAILGGTLLRRRRHR